MKDLKINLEQSAQTEMTFTVENDVMYQVLKYKPERAKKTARSVPLGKSVKGSVLFSKTGNNTIIERIRLYNVSAKKRSITIYKSPHAKVNMSGDRLSVSVPIVLHRDPEELRIALKVYADLLIEEADNIAYFLLHEASSEIEGIWQEENESNTNS